MFGKNSFYVFCSMLFVALVAAFYVYVEKEPEIVLGEVDSREPASAKSFDGGSLPLLSEKELQALSPQKRVLYIYGVVVSIHKSFVNEGKVAQLNQDMSDAFSFLWERVLPEAHAGDRKRCMTANLFPYPKEADGRCKARGSIFFRPARGTDLNALKNKFLGAGSVVTVKGGGLSVRCYDGSSPCFPGLIPFKITGAAPNEKYELTCSNSDKACINMPTEGKGEALFKSHKFLEKLNPGYWDAFAEQMREACTEGDGTVAVTGDQKLDCEKLRLQLHWSGKRLEGVTGAAAYRDKLSALFKEVEALMEGKPIPGVDSKYLCSKVEKKYAAAKSSSARDLDVEKIQPVAGGITGEKPAHPMWLDLLKYGSRMCNGAHEATIGSLANDLGVCRSKAGMPAYDNSARLSEDELIAFAVKNFNGDLRASESKKVEKAFGLKPSELKRLLCYDASADWRNIRFKMASSFDLAIKRSDRNSVVGLVENCLRQETLGFSLDSGTVLNKVTTTNRNAFGVVDSPGTGLKLICGADNFVTKNRILDYLDEMSSERNLDGMGYVSQTYMGKNYCFPFSRELDAGSSVISLNWSYVQSTGEVKEMKLNRNQFRSTPLPSGVELVQMECAEEPIAYDDGEPYTID